MSHVSISTVDGLSALKATLNFPIGDAAIIFCLLPAGGVHVMINHAFTEGMT
jgi:hypothetical protein